MSNGVRPATFEDFIGQKNVVEQARVACKAALLEDRSFPHFIMNGPPGLGKTTLAQIVANAAGGRLVTRIANVLRTPEDLLNLFLEVDRLNSVVFIDEAEQLSRQLTETLHTALEDGVLSFRSKKKNVELRLPEFTLAAATNYLGELPRPFLNRFQLVLNFEFYSHDELVQVIIGAARRLHFHITHSGINRLADVARGTPRLALRYLRRARDFAVAHHEYWRRVPGHDEKCPVITLGCTDQTLRMLGVDAEGLTRLDRRIMAYLAGAERPVGLTALAEAVNEDETTVRFVESFLVQNELVLRTQSGRTLTEKGHEHLRDQQRTSSSDEEVTNEKTKTLDDNVLRRSDLFEDNAWHALKEDVQHASRKGVSLVDVQRRQS